MKVGVEKSGAAEFRAATGAGLGRRLGGFGGTRFYGLSLWNFKWRA